MSASHTDVSTGVDDKDYDLVLVWQQALEDCFRYQHFAADAGRRLWLRSERQTLRRLPGTGAVVFTIRTQQAPLDVLAARPALRTRLAAAVASWSGPLVAYRGGEAVRRPLLDWLRDGNDGTGTGTC